MRGGKDRDSARATGTAKLEMIDKENKKYSGYKMKLNEPEKDENKCCCIIF